MGNEKIRSVLILPSERGAENPLRWKANAIAYFWDGHSQVVLSWYDDELTFTEADFIGKTRQQVIDLFMQRDKEYLQS